VERKPGGLFLYTVVDDCYHDIPHLSGSVIFTGSCSSTSIDVEGGFDMREPAWLVGVTSEEDAEVFVTMKITEFSVTSMTGTYTMIRMAASVIDCYDAGTFSVKKTGGGDDCRGLAGRWSGMWMSNILLQLSPV